jgi:nucleotide sugar dehydrogenase
MKLGIIGLGFVGGTLKKWLENETQHELLLSDTAKGYDDDIFKSDAIFICVPVPTKENDCQDYSIFEDVCQNLPDVPIFIRSTVLPGTCTYLGDKFNRQICALPEFLREKTVLNDFYKLPIICGSHSQFIKIILEEIFSDKHIIIMSNEEAEMCKYTHNCFLAMKVTFFNMIYSKCQQQDINYQSIVNGLVSLGSIKQNHTQVPGNDGKFGYGGTCFPKDMRAFSKFIDFDNNNLIDYLIKMNTKFRNK